jgi:radical SAM superfamily enzyme YgiQ (UPF0313 family)
LFIVGFESGDAQILKNIKKGATTEMAREFMKNCKKVGIKVHGDFIIGLPGETKDTINKTIDFAKELDCETIQVSLAHAMPGTELHEQMSKEGFLRVEALADKGGHQLPHIEFPHLSKADMMAGVTRFYDEYYFRPKVVWRIVKDALWDSHERKRLYHEVGAKRRRCNEDHGGSAGNFLGQRQRLTPKNESGQQTKSQDSLHGLADGGVRQHRRPHAEARDAADWRRADFRSGNLAGPSCHDS